MFHNSYRSLSSRMSWPSKFGWYTHQNSVKRVLKDKLTKAELNRVVFAVYDADRSEWQTVEFSHRHAMTPVNVSAEQAKKDANSFVATEIQSAQRLYAANNWYDAMLHLGYAIHCLQDATSPAHAGLKFTKEGMPNSESMFIPNYSTRDQIAG